MSGLLIATAMVACASAAISRSEGAVKILLEDVPESALHQHLRPPATPRLAKPCRAAALLSRRRPVRLLLLWAKPKISSDLLDAFDARVVLLTRKTGNLASNALLYVPSIINRDAVAKLIESIIHRVPKVAALMFDVDSTLRNAREQSNVMLSRASVNPHALDDDSGPSDILPDRAVSAPSRVQESFGLVTQLAMPGIDARLLSLSFLPSYVHDRVDY